MTKRKTKFHKIKIHHNRWLIWAIAYVILVAIAMAGYIKVSDIQFDSELRAENDFKSYRSYSDQKNGFSLRYPSDWSIEANSDSSISFIPSDSPDLGVTVATMQATAEKTLRNTLDIADENPTVVDGLTGTEIKNTLNRGHFETVVLVKNKTKLFVIRGTENLVERIIQTFRFSQK